jgi:hypothetical protein
MTMYDLRDTQKITNNDDLENAPRISKEIRKGIQQDRLEEKHKKYKLEKGTDFLSVSSKDFFQAEMTFTADLFLAMHWRDHRYVHNITSLQYQCPKMQTQYFSKEKINHIKSGYIQENILFIEGNTIF